MKILRSFSTVFVPLLLASIQASASDNISSSKRDAFFSRIFQTNAWIGKNSISGPGSELGATENIRAALPELLKYLGAKILLDAPCGDFHWMQAVDLSFLDSYVGADIVLELVENNSKQFGSLRVRFIKVDIVQDTLPVADVMLCRDCLVHLSNKDIAAFIRNLKRSSIRYLLTTTYTGLKANADFTGQSLANLARFRPINLQLSPYNFPAPLWVMRESDVTFFHYVPSTHKLLDRSLALWKVEDLLDVTMG